MKFNELEIFINAHNEIVLKQKENVVRITADQTDILADEILSMATKIDREKTKQQKKEEGEQE